MQAACRCRQLFWARTHVVCVRVCMYKLNSHQQDAGTHTRNIAAGARRSAAVWYIYKYTFGIKCNNLSVLGDLPFSCILIHIKTDGDIKIITSSRLTMKGVRYISLHKRHIRPIQHSAMQLMGQRRQFSLSAIARRSHESELKATMQLQIFIKVHIHALMRQISRLRGAKVVSS
jgi:hypothetical protein